MKKKRCSRCKIPKSRTRFSKNKARKDGLCNNCKLCCKEIRSLELPKKRQYQRQWELNKRYGISPEEVDRILQFQGGICALCKTNDPGSKHKNWQIDHCHKTGVVRGLLCRNCNMILGTYEKVLAQFGRQNLDAYVGRNILGLL